MTETGDQEQEREIDIYEGPCPDCGANCFIRTLRVPGQSPLIPDDRAMVTIALDHKAPDCAAFAAMAEPGGGTASAEAIEAWLKRAGMWPLPSGELVRQGAS